MALELPKADDLRIVRSLCHFLFCSNNRIASVEDLGSWLADRAADGLGHEWRRTRVYHYTSAARELGLIAKPNPHAFELTAKGCEMVEANPNLLLPLAPLNEREKTLFWELLPTYEAVRRALTLFMRSGVEPNSLDEFVALGQAVRISRSANARYELKSASNQTHDLGLTEKGSFAWTLYSWLRTLDAADDIYEENTASFLLKERTIRVFYPVRIKSFFLEDLRARLLAEASQIKQPVAIFFIPQLLSDICANEGIRKLEFLNGLIELNSQDPIQFHLEMMSSLRRDSRGLQYYKYLNFPEVKGVLRSHLWVSVKAR